MIQRVLLITSLLILGGCTIPTKQEFDQIRVEMRSAQFRRDVNAECVKLVAKRPLWQRKNVATYVKVSLDRVPTVFCKRIIHGLHSRQLKYSDLQTAKQTRKATPNLMRILRGG